MTLLPENKQILLPQVRLSILIVEPILVELSAGAALECYQTGVWSHQTFCVSWPDDAEDVLIAQTERSAAVGGQTSIQCLAWLARRALQILCLADG